LEMALRYFAFRNRPYEKGLDVHEYLDAASINMASNTNVDRSSEEATFKKTFALLDEALGADAFKKWDGTRFTGPSLLSAFEVIAYGLSLHVGELDQLPRPDAVSFVQERARKVWQNETFRKNSGAGVRGTARLSNNLPLAHTFFTP
jgi:hypothetical protein